MRVIVSSPSHADPRLPVPSSSLVLNRPQRPYNPRQKSFSKRSASLETPREVPLPKANATLSTLPDIQAGPSGQRTRMREGLDVCRKGASSVPLPDPPRGESVEQLSHPVFLGHPASPSRINPPTCAKDVLSPIRSSSSASSVLTPLRSALSPPNGSAPGVNGSPTRESEAVVSRHSPSVGVNTTPSAYTLSIHLPSFHRDEITVSLRKHRVLHIVADRFLTLSNVLHNTEDEHFEKRISFGYDADMRGVRAEYSDGVLRVIVPRKEVFVAHS